jgi:polyisoprenyl-phosphate glycosyltransferase
MAEGAPASATPAYSLVVPVYRNEGSVPELLEAVAGLARELPGLEAIFVVDGSPDRSLALLADGLASAAFPSTLIALSRNFGSFNAIKVGLEHASAPYAAVMAADLQEPPELVLEFFRRLASGDVDVVVGTRSGRDDPLRARLPSTVFWRVYRRLVNRDVPPGGVDVFGCNARFRAQLVALRETNTSLVALIFWLGFRRAVVPYARQPRRHGRSAWTVRRRFRYLADSVFAFTDFPIRMLVGVGAAGLAFSVLLAASVLVANVAGDITVPGYSATVLTVTFFGALNCFGLGVIGSYVWRAYENTKGRPQAIVMARSRFDGADEP